MFALVAFAALFAYSCGDSGSSTDNGGSGGAGGSTKGTLTTHTGNNTIVTETNAPTVSAMVMAKSYDVFGKAMSTIKYAKPAVGTTMNLDGRVEGTKSGYAQVKGTMMYDMSGSTMGSYTYNFTCTFYDFADTSDSIWMGGAIVYTGTMMSNAQGLTYNLTFKGGLKFNGEYEGAQDFTTTYSLTGQTVTYTYTSTITSGGKSFTYNSKYPE